MTESIIVTGTIACGAVFEILKKERGELKKRFPSFFTPVDRMTQLYMDPEVFANPAFVSASASECSGSAASAGECPGSGDGCGSANPETASPAVCRKTAIEAIAKRYGARACFEMGEGGIFKALWDLGEETKSGLEVDIKKIPLRQETVEILELADRNPYEEDSRGSMLMACADGVGLMYALEEAGIPCTNIGRLTKGRAKTLTYEGHLRYLDKPRKYLK